eukprot:scaffold304515_cov18-Tisochrysis_lutea.AAC.1
MNPTIQICPGVHQSLGQQRLNSVYLLASGRFQPNSLHETAAICVHQSITYRSASQPWSLFAPQSPHLRVAMALVHC